MSTPAVRVLLRMVDTCIRKGEMLGPGDSCEMIQHGLRRGLLVACLAEMQVDGSSITFSAALEAG